MKTSMRLAFCGLFVLATTLGCGPPDPTKNPNFKPETLKDPGAVKMPEMPKPGGSGGPGPN
jgi:hypothetical protein